ncbi:hypothetical protein ACYOEI_02285 [Singulisphaera rosea]
MAYWPTITTVGKSEIQDPSRLLRAQVIVGVSLLFCLSFVPFAFIPTSVNSRVPRALEFATLLRHNISDLVIVPSHDGEIPDTPWLLAGDLCVFVEFEDINPFEEYPGGPQTFPEASHIALGDLSTHDSPRAPFLPAFAIHGLMSRRF